MGMYCVHNHSMSLVCILGNCLPHGVGRVHGWAGLYRVGQVCGMTIQCVMLLLPLLSPLPILSPLLPSCGVDVCLVQCWVRLSPGGLCQVAGQEEGICRAGQEDRGEPVQGGVRGGAAVCGTYVCMCVSSIQ